jgi:SAM-dependent methyltransferase
LGGVEDTFNHPIFARVYRFLSLFDERDMGEYRDELLLGVHGDVVEIGAGTGSNFIHFPATTSSVVAVEPENYLRRFAQARADGARIPISVRAGVAERLPVPDKSCDAAIACLVLCSVSSQVEALAEIRRTLRPGGELRFLEHVRAPGFRKARAQEFLDRSRAWPTLVGGCHCARDTVTAIESCGFEITRIRRLVIGPAWAPANPVALGAARVAEPAADRVDDSAARRP